MRPLKLTMQAFGPYADCQVLDMAALGETGIYAITGETGAGKTTIFDAIVYALYGEGSGEDRREGRGLRCVSAGPEVETKVVLEFTSGGKVYTVERRPEQVLAGRRGSATVKKPAAQVLTLPDGQRLTRFGDIREAVERDILGVTKEQFCQIVMIAQGEFRKLLQADTQARTVILRRIFKTERFDALSQRLARLSKEKYAELCHSRDQVAFALKSMAAAPGGELEGALDQLRQAKPNALFVDGAAELAGRVVREDAEAYAGAKQALDEAEAAREAARAALEQARDRAAKMSELERLRAALAEQSARLDAARARRGEAEGRRSEIEALGEAMAAEKGLLPQYARLTALRGEARDVDAALAAETAARDAAARDAGALRKRQAALSAEADALRDAPDRRLEAVGRLNAAKATGDKLATVESRLKERDDAARALEAARARVEAFREKNDRAATALADLEAALDRLGNTELALSQRAEALEELKRGEAEAQKLRDLCERHDAARRDCDAALKVYQARERAARAARADAMDLRARFNAGIAGLLAADLREGAPCPVCGSTHHPAPCARGDAPVSEDAVTAAETAATEAEASASAAAGACAGKNERRDGLAARLREALPEVAEERWREAVERIGAENAAARKLAGEALREAKQADARRRKLSEADLPRARRDAEVLAQALNDAQRAAAAAQSRRELAEGELQRAAKAVLAEDWTPLDLSDALSANAREQRAQNESAAKADRDIARAKAIEAEAKALQSEIEAKDRAAQEAEVGLSGLRTRREGLAKDAAALEAALPYANEADCRRAIDAKAARRRALEQAIEDARREEAEADNARAGLEARVSPLAAQLEGLPAPDAEAAAARHAEAVAVWEEARKRERDLAIRRESNARQAKALEKQAGAARRLEAEYRMMKDVSDTACGDVSGQDRVTLETYAQTACFDRILRYANQRLIHMSRGQYDLARRGSDKARRTARTGLDLDVVDHYNGANRAVGTLSGGEGFLASLSLALGMSDAIQASAATAVQLDTMFVDEGFGSLSDNFLNLVMDELNDTANAGRRLIGIISHVDDVKEGIERRVEVVKTGGGVSRAEIH